VHGASLDLGDDLVRDDDDIVFLKDKARRSRPFKNEARQVIAVLEHGQAGDGDDL